MGDGRILKSRPLSRPHLIPPIQQIVIDRQSQEAPLTQRVLENIKKFSEYANVDIEYIDDYKAVLEKAGKGAVHEAKDTLLIYPHKGRFIHACPGSDGMLCCNYFIINTGVNCSYDCQYCYLQSYLNTSVITAFSNTNDMLEQIRSKISSHPQRHWRIGTGEYTDSLALEHITGLGAELVQAFAEFPNATLELKTKSNNIHSLLNLDHPRNTVLSWTMSPPFISKVVEKDTASIDLRMEAAVAAQESGYDIALHFDPIVWYTEWEADYKKLVDDLFEQLNPDQIRWISLGTFRHSAGFKKILQDRFPDEFLSKAEMFPSDDQKMRYFSPIRAEMYRKMKSWIQQHDPKQFTYLCMETRDMWSRVYDNIPKTPFHLDSEFEHRRKFMHEKT